jgi:lipid-A-disaccharide synthase
MLVILPFEKDFYSRFNYPVHFVGHPLLDAIANRNQGNQETWKTRHGLNDNPVIALLPGSRKQEIATMLPLMLSVVSAFAGYTFVIAAAPSVPESFYEQFTAGSGVRIVFDATYALLENADAALVTSGTATLETALFNVPEVVCYKGNLISYHIARRLIKVKYISLVNLIMDREVVTELIQDELNTKRITEELNKLLDVENRKKLLADYNELREKLGGGGASRRAAQLIIKAVSVPGNN